MSRRRLVVALLAVVLSLAATVPHAFRAWRHEVAPWDRSLSVWLHAFENRETVLNSRVDLLGIVLHPAVHFLGVLLTLALAAALIWRRRVRLGTAIALTLLGAGVLGVVLKEVFERPPVDPNGDGHSFPSGHAMRSMAAAAAAAVALWPTSWRWPVVAVGGAAVALTGSAVVYHEWHWVSDVLAGWFLAVAWMGCVWLALRPEPLR